MRPHLALDSQSEENGPRPKSLRRGLEPDDDWVEPEDLSDGNEDGSVDGSDSESERSVPGKYAALIDELREGKSLEDLGTDYYRFAERVLEGIFKDGDVVEGQFTYPGGSPLGIRLQRTALDRVETFICFDSGHSELHEVDFCDLCYDSSAFFPGTHIPFMNLLYYLEIK